MNSSTFYQNQPLFSISLHFHLQEALSRASLLLSPAMALVKGLAPCLGFKKWPGDPSSSWRSKTFGHLGAPTSEMSMFPEHLAGFTIAVHVVGCFHLLKSLNFARPPPLAPLPSLRPILSKVRHGAWLLLTLACGRQLLGRPVIMPIVLLLIK